ncbi:Alpha/Beta hydrolase protein [Cokeromyces recurvatus]|uniref:Alpha/Beta hydrolase protein n=1 Tax=Cokeromyces recurvatus TaxID=90255 RepID=UPI002220DD24|nr:Alpha/Beta hydrolase protein [Cokeromyces recurvatus]KAI7905100.1 Alpha/Beta hydrolase protein [Cokeromyces recurvatus]
MSKVKLFHNSHPVDLYLPNAGNRKISLTDYITETCPSLVGPKAVYNPTPYLFNGHLQTGYAAFYNHAPTVNAVTYEREFVDTPDGGTFALDWARTKENLKEDETPTLVVLHGLTGGSHESYIRCLLEIVTYPPFNYRAVVMNSRGCANSEIKTPQMYSGGYTDDFRVAIQHIQKRLAPNTPLVGIGFSLGSNVLVKYLGEEGDKTPLKAAISVANPFDFRLSMELLSQSYIGRKIYSPKMAQNLKNTFARHMDIVVKGGKINPDEVMAAQTIQEFDEACTRKMFDYTTVNNYYRDASSCRFIEFVKIPLLCLNALDDPIAAADCIPYDEIKTNPNVVLATTDYGGHLGWFENVKYPTRWMVKPLTEFIVAMFQAYDVRSVQGEHFNAEAVDNKIDDIQSQVEGTPQIA